MERSALPLALAWGIRYCQPNQDVEASARTIDTTFRECAGIMSARDLVLLKMIHPNPSESTVLS